MYHIKEGLGWVFWVYSVLVGLSHESTLSRPTRSQYDPPSMFCVRHTDWWHVVGGFIYWFISCQMRSRCLLSTCTQTRAGGVSARERVLNSERPPDPFRPVPSLRRGVCRVLTARDTHRSRTHFFPRQNFCARAATRTEVQSQMRRI